MKLLHVFTGVLLLATPAFAQSSNTLGPLIGDSIFSRLRGTPTTTTTGPGTGITTPPSRVPAPTFVGTFQENDQLVAFLEVQTTRGTQLLTLHPGDTIAWDQSRVLEITPGQMQLTGSSSAARTISLGNNLLNQPATPAFTNPYTPPATRAPASPPIRNRRAPLGTTPVLR